MPYFYINNKICNIGVNSNFTSYDNGFRLLSTTKRSTSASKSGQTYISTNEFIQSYFSIIQDMVDLTSVIPLGNVVNSTKNSIPNKKWYSGIGYAIEDDDDKYNNTYYIFQYYSFSGSKTTARTFTRSSIEFGMDYNPVLSSHISTKVTVLLATRSGDYFSSTSHIFNFLETIHSISSKASTKISSLGNITKDIPYYITKYNIYTYNLSNIYVLKHNVTYSSGHEINNNTSGRMFISNFTNFLGDVYINGLNEGPGMHIKNTSNYITYVFQKTTNVRYNLSKNINL